MEPSKVMTPVEPVAAPGIGPAQTPAPAEVFTSADAAEFLRVEEGAVIAAAEAGEMPGRKVGGQWRFLKTALRIWLSTVPKAKPELSAKERLLQHAGIWKDDPSVEPMIEEIYRRRRETGGL